MEWIMKVAEWIKGYKTYLLCVSAIIAAIAGWADDQITFIQLVQAIWVALTGIAVRAGIKNK